MAVYKTGASGGCRVANVGSTTDGGVPALAIVVAATGCKVVAEWPQTSNPATGTYTDNQATWAPDGAQDARGDVFQVELL